MKKLVIPYLLLGILSAFSVKAFDVITVDKEETPIPSAHVTFYNLNKDSIGCAITDSSGKFSYPDSTAYLKLSHPKYDDLVVNVTRDKDRYLFMLPSGTTLKEVTVTPDMMQQFKTHDSFTIPRKEMEKYATTLGVLNEIPFVSITNATGLSYQGSKNIKLLIDGVVASEDEVNSLSKDDIYKVDLYTTPPPQLAAEGLDAVIDIRLKSSLRGGNGYISLSDGVNKVVGNNKLAFYYNYKRSRFSINYYNNYNRSKGGYTDSKMSYTFDNNNYDKIKEGLPDKSVNNENSVNIAFQNGLENNYLFKTSFSGNITRSNSYSAQNVTLLPLNDKYTATTNTSSPFENFRGYLYFQKNLGENSKNGILYSSLTYNRYNSKDYYFYQESSVDDNENSIPFSATTDEKSYTNGIHALVAYSTLYRRWGMLNVNLQNNFENYKLTNVPNSTPTKRDWANLFATYMYAYKKFTFVETAGVAHSYYSTYAGSQSGFVPFSMTTIYYRPKKQIRFTLGYSVGKDGATLAQLTETPHWRDNYYVYHGNANLKTYNTHQLNFAASYFNKYVEVAVRGSYYNANNYIGTMFLPTDDYILETLINEKKHSLISGNCSLKVLPLGSRIWQITGYVSYGRVSGENSQYTYNGIISNYNASTSVNLKKWNFEVSGQFPSTKFNGNTTRTRSLIWDISAVYRPTENISVGAEWSNPFSKKAKEREYTVPEALINFDANSYWTTFCNLVKIQFTYYFNFGKKHNKMEAAYDEMDGDSGKLIRN